MFLTSDLDVFFCLMSPRMSQKALILMPDSSSHQKADREAGTIQRKGGECCVSGASVSA